MEIIQNKTNSNINNTANNNMKEDEEEKKTDFEQILEGTFITLEKDIPTLLEFGNLGYVREHVKIKPRKSKFTEQMVDKVQFLVKEPDEPIGIERILETTVNQGRKIIARIKLDRTIYKITKTGEGMKSTYNIEAVS